MKVSRDGFSHGWLLGLQVVEEDGMGEPKQFYISILILQAAGCGWPC